MLIGHFHIVPGGSCVVLMRTVKSGNKEVPEKATQKNTSNYTINITACVGTGATWTYNVDYNVDSIQRYQSCSPQIFSLHW